MNPANKHLWHLVTRPFPPLQAYAYIVGHRDYVDYGYSYTASLPEGKYGENAGNSIWLLEEEYYDHWRKLGEKAAKEGGFVDDLVNDCYVRADKLMDISKAIRSATNLSSNDDYFFLLSGYFDAYLKFTRHLFTPHYVEEYFSRSIREWLYEALKKNGGEIDKVDVYFERVTPIPKKTRTTEFQLDALKLLDRLDLDNNAKDLKSFSISEENSVDFRNLLEGYSWLPMINIAGHPMNEQSLNLTLEGLLNNSESPAEKAKQIMSGLKKQEEIASDTLIKLSAPDGIIKQINQLKEFIYLRTYRMEIYGRSHFLISPFLNELSKKLGIDPQLIKHTTHEELLLSLRRNVNPSADELRLRTVRYAILMKDRVILPVIAGEQADKIKGEQLGNSNQESEKSILKGTPASLGSAIGPVRIVKSLADVKKIERGDILVTAMTSTEYTPYLSKVAAVVTDEGGVTSHAALVTRELGIPCVVGTDTATSVLRDGMKVRVDADKGIIVVLR